VRYTSSIPSFLRVFSFLKKLLLYWGYIVTFTKVSHYIILEFTPLCHFSLSLLPPFLEQFQQVSFPIFIHEYTIFPPYSPSYTLLLHPPSSHWCQPPNRTCFISLFSIF
jgi:hypothetical protein